MARFKHLQLLVDEHIENVEKLNVQLSHLPVHNIQHYKIREQILHEKQQANRFSHVMGLSEPFQL